MDGAGIFDSERPRHGRPFGPGRREKCGGVKGRRCVDPSQACIPNVALQDLTPFSPMLAPLHDFQSLYLRAEIQATVFPMAKVIKVESRPTKSYVSMPLSYIIRIKPAFQRRNHSLLVKSCRIPFTVTSSLLLALAFQQTCVSSHLDFY